MTVKRTRLCYWIAWLAKQGTPVECVPLSFHTHPCVLAFITHILRINGIEMTFVWLIPYTLSYIFFKFAICFVALVNLGETCYLKRRNLVTAWRMMLLLCCYHCDCMQQHYDVTQFEYVVWRHTMHEWVMNIHYKTWIAQGRFTNLILTPSKQWGVCDNSVLAMELRISCTNPLIWLHSLSISHKSCTWYLKYVIRSFCEKTLWDKVRPSQFPYIKWNDGSKVLLVNQKLYIMCSCIRNCCMSCQSLCIRFCCIRCYKGNWRWRSWFYIEVSNILSVLYEILMAGIPALAHEDETWALSLWVQNKIDFQSIIVVLYSISYHIILDCTV